MKVFDLTQTICNDMPVYSEGNGPNIRKVAELESNGYQETLLTMFSHNGTHIDSPKHMYAKGKTLDELDINKFIGKACLIELDNSNTIELNYLKKYEDKIVKSDFIIFKSGWEKYWGSPKYYENYPILTKEAANYIATSNIKGIGIDMLSIDRYDSIDFEIHHILFEEGKVIIENLTNLNSLPEEFIFAATPLKYKDADGSPVRAIGIEM